MKIKAIYVQQYDYFWKLTPEQWRRLLIKGLEGDGHLLPKVEMKRRPSKVRAEWLGDSKNYYVVDSDVLYYEPLDWEVEDYQAALNDLDALEADNG